jgi:hypothetical protein
MSGRFPGVLPPSVPGTRALPEVFAAVLSPRAGAAPGLGRSSGGGEAGEGLAAAPGFRGEPGGGAAFVSSCRTFQACRMRWLRTISREVTASMRGVTPMRRHQSQLMSLLAGPWRW